MKILITPAPSGTNPNPDPESVELDDADLLAALIGCGADAEPVGLMDAVQFVLQSKGDTATEGLTTNSSAYKRIGTRLKALGETGKLVSDGANAYRIERTAEPGRGTRYAVAAQDAPEPQPEAPASDPEVIDPEVIDPEVIDPEEVAPEDAPQDAPEGDAEPSVYALERYTPDTLAAMGRKAVEKAQPELTKMFDQLTERARLEIAGLPERIDPQDAMRLIVLFDRRETLHSDAGLMERFKLGVIARRVSENSGYGDNAMNLLSEATGVHVGTVRQCRRLAERYDDNVTLFSRFLRTYREKTGRPVRWYHVEKLIGTFSDPTVLGPEELYDRIARGIEQAAERAEQAAGEDVEDGLMLTLTDAASTARTKGLHRLAETKAALDAGDIVPGVFIPRDEHFMRFVGGLPCAVTGDTPPDGGWGETRLANDPHHVGTGGTAIKGSDYTCIPLSREAHDFLHQQGVKAFNRKYRCNVALIMFQTLHLYLSEVKADLPSALIAA